MTAKRFLSEDTTEPSRSTKRRKMEAEQEEEINGEPIGMEICESVQHPETPESFFYSKIWNHGDEPIYQIVIAGDKMSSLREDFVTYWETTLPLPKALTISLFSIVKSFPAFSELGILTNTITTLWISTPHQDIQIKVGDKIWQALETIPSLIHLTELFVGSYERLPIPSSFSSLNKLETIRWKSYSPFDIADVPTAETMNLDALKTLPELHTIHINCWMPPWIMSHPKIDDIEHMVVALPPDSINPFPTCCSRKGDYCRCRYNLLNISYPGWSFQVWANLRARKPPLRTFPSLLTIMSVLDERKIFNGLIQANSQIVGYILRLFIARMTADPGELKATSYQYLNEENLTRIRTLCAIWSRKETLLHVLPKEILEKMFHGVLKRGLKCPDHLL